MNENAKIDLSINASCDRAARKFMQRNKKRLFRKEAAASVLLQSLVACSSDSDGKTYKVVFNETIESTESSAVVDDGTKNGLFEAGGFKLAFENPISENVKIGAEGLTISIKPWNEPPTATWSLYYTTAFKDLTTAKPIFEGIPISVHEVTWSTSAMKTGDYYLFAEGRTDVSRSLFWLPTKISISNDAPAGAPQVVISTDTDGQVFNNGETLRLDYNAISTEGTNLLFNVFISPDNGSTWQQIETATNKKSTTITFDAATFSQGARYKFKVEADNGLLQASTESDGNFGFSPADVTFNGEIKTITDAKCGTSGCHDGTRNNKGDFNAKTYTDLANQIGTFKGIDSSRELIYSYTTVQSPLPMPPADAAQLSDAERDLIALWAWGGYKKAAQ